MIIEKDTSQNLVYIFLAILLFGVLAFVAYKLISNGINSLNKDASEPWYKKIF